MKKLIITAALTGSLPTKEKNPAVPISPDEIAQDARRCYEAGASVVHIHARDRDGKNCHDTAIFQEIHDKIKALAPELIVQLSTGGRAGMSYESRRKCLFVCPEMASLSTGSVNFATSVYANEPQLIDDLAQMMRERNIKPEMEIFDTNMIRPGIQLEERGLIQKPLYFSFIMGARNCQEASIGQLAHLLTLLPPGAEWSVGGIGANQITVNMFGIAAGGHVRVGLEDNLYYKKGVLASNVQLVERVARIAREIGREIAAPADARALLGLSPQEDT